MLNVLSISIYLTSALLAIWALWFVIANRAVILKQLLFGAAVELLLVGQSIYFAVVLLSTERTLIFWEFWGYVVTMLIILPLAALWAFAERTRWSSVVLLVAAITVAFLQYRVIVLWG